MSKFSFVTAFLLIALYGCNNSSESSSDNGEDNSTKQYYPIASYIESQLKYLDSVPLAIMHYTTINNVTDTTIAEKKDFRNSVGAAFIQSDISGTEQKKKYDETSFIDATLGVITLTYTPRKNENDLPVSKIDVLLSQENSAVKTIYIEKVLRGGDSTVLKKMLWKANKSCQVTSIIEKNSQPARTIQERFVWDETF
ncbi:MAG: hypothetical protein ACTHMM_02715 [Agriterribacter sp.]